ALSCGQLVVRNHSYAQAAIAGFQGHEFRRADVDRRRSPDCDCVWCGRAEGISLRSRLGQNMAGVGISRYCGLDSRIYGLHLVAALRISHKGRNLRLRESGSCGRDRLLVWRRECRRADVDGNRPDSVSVITINMGSTLAKQRGDSGVPQFESEVEEAG